MPIIDQYERRFQDIANRLLTADEDPTLVINQWRQQQSTTSDVLTIEAEFQLSEVPHQWLGTFTYCRPNPQSPWRLMTIEAQVLA